MKAFRVYPKDYKPSTKNKNQYKSVNDKHTYHGTIQLGLYGFHLFTDLTAALTYWGDTPNLIYSLVMIDETSSQIQYCELPGFICVDKYYKINTMTFDEAKLVDKQLTLEKELKLKQELKQEKLRIKTIAKNKKLAPKFNPPVIVEEPVKKNKKKIK